MLSKSNKFKLLLCCLIIVVTSLSAQQYSLDTTFESTYKIRLFDYPNKYGYVVNIHELDDGSIIIGGEMNDPTDNYFNWTLIKLNEYGVFDPTFYYGFVDGISNFITYEDFIYLLNSWTISKVDIVTGYPDTSFYNNLVLSDWLGIYNDIYVCDNGDFLIAGLNGYHISLPDEIFTYISRIKSNGFYDTTFYHMPDNDVTSIIKYDEERLLIAGMFNYYDSIPIKRMARIYNDGLLDTTFHSIFEGYKTPKPLYIQPDGKILVGNLFNIENNSYILGLVRLNQDGSLDSTFNNFNNAQTPYGLWITPQGYGHDYRVLAICPTEDGKYLIGGYFPNYQGNYRGRIALVDYNGYLDTTAFTGSGFDLWNDDIKVGVLTIKSTSDNKYWIGGLFSRFNGIEVEPVIRIYGHTYGIEQTDISIPNICVYPNPANDLIYINSEQQIDYIEIYNYMGQFLSKHIMNTTKGSIDISHYQNGNYFFKSYSDKGVIVSKIVVIK